METCACCGGRFCGEEMVAVDDGFECQACAHELMMEAEYAKVYGPSRTWARVTRKQEDWI